MKVLERYKKTKMEGFKKFVQNLETTEIKKRVDQFLNCVLEDPIFMDWVAKNIMTINDFFDFKSNELETICQEIPQGISLLVKAFHKTPFEKSLLNVLPLEYKNEYEEEIKERAPILTSRQVEEAQFALIKQIRSLQEKNIIYGHPWKLPTVEVVTTMTNYCQTVDVSKKFDNGVMAYEGKIKNGKRDAQWTFYFTSGSILARGSYEKDIKEGPWIFFYPNGNKKSQGHYHENKKAGPWIEWDRKGNETMTSYN